MQYRLDFTKRYYVRELGKLLGTSHVTLLPHLQSLEEENVLVAKTIGKNKEYKLNYKNFLVKELLEVAEKYAVKDFFEKNKNLQKLHENICDLRLINPIIISESNIYCIGELSEDVKSKINSLIKINSAKDGIKFNLTIISSEDFHNRFISHDIEIKKLLKNRIVIQNSGFIINLLWRNYVEFRRGEEI